MNILIVGGSSLGDIIHNMPKATDLCRQFPMARVDWVVEEAYVPLVQLHQGISTVIPVAMRRWRKQIMNPDTRLEIKHSVTVASM